MISDAEKISLDVVTKQFFSCRMIFFLATRTYFSLLGKYREPRKKNLVPREKILCQEKISWGKKKAVL